VTFWNLISSFVEVVATYSISLFTWTCHLLGFVIGLLLLGLLVGCFVYLKNYTFWKIFSTFCPVVHGKNKFYCS
jgi:hypothetical protein